MKVFNLGCELQHGFEGWFASETDYDDQVARGFLECPVCSSKQVVRLPSAPRLNFGARSSESASEISAQADASNEAPTPAVKQASAEGVAGSSDLALHAAWLHMARQVLQSTEDVGQRFAEEARKIYYGEAEERGIRGQATREQTESLLEEGIAVMPLVLPEVLKSPLH